MSEPLYVIEHRVRCAVLIENGLGDTGSGFLLGWDVGKDPSGGTRWRVFAVTNKHVLHRTRSIRHTLSSIKLGMNRKRVEDGKVVGESYRVLMRGTNGQPMWREHPEDAVDVAAVEVTRLFKEHSDLHHVWINQGDIATAALRESAGIGVGEDILVVGYPLGLRLGESNYPLLRQGMIATRIGELLHEESDDGTVRVTRGFLVDGTIPGSSGSPVYLKPYDFNTVVAGARPEGLLLGIIAETRFAPIDTPSGEVPAYAGLGLAYDAETVRETIQQFGI